MSSQTIEKASIYCFSVFRIEVGERRLWGKDELIPLTPKQFDLLTYFVENAGRITKKNELLDAIWADTFIEEATLARNISWLRSKLQEYTDCESVIETVPKLGYRFTAEVTRAAAEPTTLSSETQTALVIRSEEVIHFNDGAIAEQEETESPEARETIEFPKPHAPSRRRPLALLALLFIVIAGIALAGSIYIRSRNAPKTAAQTPNTAAQPAALRVNATITIRNIAVDATQQATEAGIKVLPGDTVLVGAEGLHQPDPGQTWTLEGDKKAKVSGKHTFQQADPWSLVGWIGTTEADQTNYFQVSKASPITSNKSGFLYFALNDWRHEYANNCGGLLVTVTLTRTFDISAETDDIQAACGNELIRLYKEDLLAVTAAGMVSYWLGGELYDLNGSQHKLDGLLAPMINTRSLIGKIGSRNPFKIGTNYPPQRVGANGCFFISVNDQITRRGAFKNNSGNISVGIEVVRAPETFRNPI
jgi:DNA-binding winged helix-turn-helix (wHTH) protein